ncbi:unnamed protein product [Callosobruchus maculatus]|uniref:Coiled-coil domain-containing protein 167 n=1 Tax=Callosobruchus maculatus TaxID=64391 RepID=A0A653D7F6_CALMS|nr:unnamed protein product [Callosobruchus maculatus]
MELCYLTRTLSLGSLPKYKLLLLIRLCCFIVPTRQRDEKIFENDMFCGAAEEALKSTYSRLEAIEKKLQNENLSESKQKQLQQEVEEVRKLLKTHEDQLAHLRTHNRTTFVFVVCLMFIIFAVYMLYILVRGSEF